MTDREALLRAVAANPDDDTPRLIFADHLDELGGGVNVARARFIRLQIEMAREVNRGWFSQAERLSEACQLAGQFATYWMDELPRWVALDIPGVKPGAEDFVRGFLESVQVRPWLFTQQGDQLLDLAPVRKVEVPLPPDRGGILPFLRSEFLSRIRCLTICCANGDLVAECAASVTTLHGVEELEVRGPAGISDAGAASFANAIDLRNLRLLRVRGHSLNPVGVTALLTSPLLPRLEELDLGYSPMARHWIADFRNRFPKKLIRT